MVRAALLAIMIIGLCTASMPAAERAIVPLTDAEIAMVRSMSLSALPPLALDTTNRFADQAGPAAFGATLFFEQRLSRDGNVACSTCHMIDRQFQDGRRFGVAVGETRRRTMPLTGVAHNDAFFWDGRRDSLWSQALTPMEDPLEYASNRIAVLRAVKTHLRDRYEHVFGPLPGFEGLPQDAGPLGSEAERTAWAAIPQTRREAIDTAFANLGKALAAFERTLTHEPTRFDRFADGLIAESEAESVFTHQELAGLRLFIGKAGCVACHSGPRFTDGMFHVNGAPQPADRASDLGRAEGLPLLAADPFNCFGNFRDGPVSACNTKYAPTESDHHAFKTPSLRGVADRAPYMHAGQFATLEAIVDHYDRAPKIDGRSEMQPLHLSLSDKAALVEFLKTLSDQAYSDP